MLDAVPRAPHFNYALLTSALGYGDFSQANAFPSVIASFAAKSGCRPFAGRLSEAGGKSAAKLFLSFTPGALGSITTFNYNPRLPLCHCAPELLAPPRRIPANGAVKLEDAIDRGGTASALRWVARPAEQRSLRGAERTEVRVACPARTYL